MPIVKTQGVIIAKRDFSEGDRIFWILTENQGLIQALGKGVRKILAKMSGFLEVGNLVNLQLYKGRTFYTITDVQTVNSFAKLKNELAHASLIYHFFEVVKTFVPLEENRPEIFWLLVRGLANFDCQPSPILKIYFELKFIKNIGFGPELHHCAVCRRALPPGGNFFSAAEGGTICPACAVPSGISQKVSDQTIKMMRWLRLEEIEALAKLTSIDSRVVREADRILAFYMEFLAEKKLHGNGFLEKVNQLYKNGKKLVRD